jgi:dTDP-4-amino-4,6-dideoxygalactose transaminase
VHEFGLPADIEKIVALAKEHSLHVIEDAACALGATVGLKKVGTFGDYGCFSFHPRKTITTGEGGAIATNDDHFANRIKTLRNHGMMRSPEGMEFVEASTNYRMTNFQAALGRAQLPHLQAWIEKRRELVSLYVEGLADLVDSDYISLPVISKSHSYQTFMIRLNQNIDRLSLINNLRDQGVESNLGAQCLNELMPFKTNNEVLFNSRLLANHGLALPMYEKLMPEQVKIITKTLHELIPQTMS